MPVLVTSRDSLTGLVAREGAKLLVLDVLAPEEALELLGRVAGADRVAAEPEAAAEAVRRCGCLPLAVSIAAAKLAARPRMRIEELAGCLANEPCRLGELAAGDVEVRASFALSYTELSRAAARMFRRLGLIAGPDFTAGAAAALADATPEEAEALLEALVDAHLLEDAPAPGRYRFHDLLRLYAQERVQQEETECEGKGALGRLLEWYRTTAHDAERLLVPGRRGLLSDRPSTPHRPLFTTRTEAVAWFEAERANLVAASCQAADSGVHPIAWQLADAMRSGFFEFSWHGADSEEVHRAGLTAARKANNPQAEAWMLTNLGQIYGGLRRFEEASNCLEQALVICREVGYRQGEGRALHTVGIVYGKLHRFAEAVAYCEQALAIHRQIEDRWRQGWSLNYLGEAYGGLHRFEEAIDCHRQALTIHQEVGVRWVEGLTLNYLGEAYRGLHRFNDTIDCHRQALTIHREVGHRWLEGMTLHSFGLTLQRTHDMDAAQACWREALRIFTDLGAPEADDIRSLLEGVRTASSRLAK